MPDFAQEPGRENHDEGDLGGGKAVEILREVGESPERYGPFEDDFDGEGEENDNGGGNGGDI